MPFCNGTDTSSKFARHESEQTSDRCWIMGKHLDGLIFMVRIDDGCNSH